MIRLISVNHPLVLDGVVEPDGGELLGEQVAQQFRDEALFAEQDGRRALGFATPLHLGPDLLEIGEVGHDVFFGPVRRRRADDHAAGQARLLAEPLDDGPQPPPLVARLDLARHADVIDRRHVDQEAAGQAQMRGDAGALRAERLLDDLDDDLLALFQQVFDAGGRRLLVAIAAPARRPARVEARPIGPAGGPVSSIRRRRPRRRAASSPSAGRRVGLGAGVVSGHGDRQLLVVLEGLFGGADDVRDVQEGVAFETEVNERRLHPRQDLRDPALVDVADDAARLLALDEDFDDLIVLEDRHAGLVAGRGDDHLLVHACDSTGPAPRFATDLR